MDKKPTTTQENATTEQVKEVKQVKRKFVKSKTVIYNPNGQKSKGKNANLSQTDMNDLFHLQTLI